MTRALHFRGARSVFSLNVTQANFNSLQVGLQNVSATTGGLLRQHLRVPGARDGAGRSRAAGATMSCSWTSRGQRQVSIASTFISPGAMAPCSRGVVTSTEPSTLTVRISPS